jgi:2-polyprenyl-6-methoxyphenol hydroxylase-like FAD-dependent oxidoreductase
MVAAPFQVVICGGGVAGLTLANALEQAGISYVMLESKSEIAPKIGSSIAISGGGARVLDQLGCYDALTHALGPVSYIKTWKDGKFLYKTDHPLLNSKRTGYRLGFTDRPTLLSALKDNIKDQNTLLVSKVVSRVAQDARSATVFCQDGSSYTADVVVGADVSIMQPILVFNIRFFRPRYCGDFD